MERLAGRRGRKGQALVEFCLVLIIVLLLCLGTIELGQAASLSLRMASTVYQAGRLINAESLWPSTANTDAQNKTMLKAGLTDDIYPAVKGMIYPADVASRGTVIFTYLTRVIINASDSSQDVLRITGQWYFSGGSVSESAPSSNLASKVAYTTTGSGTNIYKNVSASFFDKEALVSGQSTVVVEIYHQTDPMTAKFSNVLSLARKIYTKDTAAVTPLLTLFPQIINTDNLFLFAIFLFPRAHCRGTMEFYHIILRCIGKGVRRM
jgi:Flp pilus assembly protein TadG